MHHKCNAIYILRMKTNCGTFCDALLHHKFRYTLALFNIPVITTAAILLPFVHRCPSFRVVLRCRVLWCQASQHVRLETDVIDDDEEGLLERGHREEISRRPAHLKVLVRNFVSLGNPNLLGNVSHVYFYCRAGTNSSQSILLIFGIEKNCK